MYAIGSVERAPCRSVKRSWSRLSCTPSAGRVRADPADGVAVGWAGGDHVLDLTLDLGKNIINDALHLAIRVDTDKIPGSLLRAYTKIETDARAQLNPSGHPTKAQRQEAKEAARIRAEAEAADGRFRRMAHYPGPLGRPVEHPVRGIDEHDSCSSGCKPCSARRLTARSSPSRPAAWRMHRPRPGVRNARWRTSVLSVIARVTVFDGGLVRG